MTDVDVYLDTGDAPKLVGRAHFARRAGRVTTTFRYESSYLSRSGAGPVDPALALYSGNQYVDRLPGAFGDSAPDRWGRNLLDRRERARARSEGRSARSFDDVDYLLGVSDETRQGALRYLPSGEEHFASPDSDVPRLVALPRLLRASEAVEEHSDSPEVYKILLDAGTASLGGARPKASVKLNDGRLTIAKFPHVTDEWDVMAWEATALELAGRAGIRVPDFRLVPVGAKNVLLLARFDRADAARRVGYMSAMTLLQRRDGDGGDYAELSDAVSDVSSHPRRDRLELFDRVVFNIAMRNTDDHLRNHGLLSYTRGWRLSPIFDVNPNPQERAARQTSIAGAVSPSDEWDGLVALAAGSGIPARETVDRVGRIIDSAAGWRDVAAARGIPRAEQNRMADGLDTAISTLREGVARLRAAGDPRTRARGKSTPSSTSGSFMAAATTTEHFAPAAVDPAASAASGSSVVP